MSEFQDDVSIRIWKTLVKIDEKLEWIKWICVIIAIGVLVLAEHFLM